MVAEDEFLGLKIKQMRFLEENGDRLFLELSVGLMQVLDDFEVNSLVLDQHCLNSFQGFQRVDAEDLIEEVIVGVVKELQSLFMDLSQVRNV